MASLRQPLRLLRNWGNALLDLLYPPHCHFCRVGTKGANEILCPTCRKNGCHPIGPIRCERCSRPFDGLITSAFQCPDCLEEAPKFQYAVAHYRMRDIVREAIHRFKYHGEMPMRFLLVEWLEEALCDPRLSQGKIDALVPVPLHPTRWRERGFNQAEILCQLLSKRRGIPTLPALKRTRFTPSQTQLSRADRIENLRNAFIVGKNTPVTNLNLLVIDDVLTSGSTVNECAAVLLKAGAATVRVATVARG